MDEAERDDSRARGDTIEPIASSELALLRDRFEALRGRRRALGEALEGLAQVAEDLGAEAQKRLRASGAAEAQIARFEEAKERSVEAAEARLRELLEAEGALREVIARVCGSGPSGPGQSPSS